MTQDPRFLTSSGGPQHQESSHRHSRTISSIIQDPRLLTSSGGPQHQEAPHQLQQHVNHPLQVTGVVILPTSESTVRPDQCPRPSRTDAGNATLQQQSTQIQLEQMEPTKHQQQEHDEVC